MTNFKKGDKVICIDGSITPYKKVGNMIVVPVKNRPIENEIYTVRDVIRGGLLLEEVVNEPNALSDGTFGETSFRFSRFAPIIIEEKKAYVEKSILEFDFSKN